MAAHSLADIFAGAEQIRNLPAAKVKSARSQNRAAAYAYDLAQWRTYKLAMAPDEAERNIIEQAYRRRLEEGPDFAHYHVGSDFSEPPIHQLTPEDKRTMLNAFDQVRAWLWRNARKPRGQAVSRAYREVLSVLLSFALKYGRVYPSLATIARLACCSERTVANALQWLRTFGFLDWQRRLKRTAGLLGAVVRQTSNAYRLALSGIGAFLSGAGRNNSGPSQFTTNTIGNLGLEKPGVG
jgi:hypothetical protein